MKKMRLDDEKIFWAVTGLYFLVFMSVDIVVALMEHRLRMSYMAHGVGAGVVLFGVIWGP